MQQSALWVGARDLLEKAAGRLRSEEGRLLASSVQWWELPGFPDRWPVAVLGDGPPLLLLQGFDTSFLDFELLAPLLASRYRVLIPDLCGFGFCPRPRDLDISPDVILRHLEALIDSPAYHLATRGRAASLPPAPLGVVGASMGARVALELARRRPDRVECLMLLSPAGLTEPPLPLPLPPLIETLTTFLLSLWLTRFALHRFMHAVPDRTFGYKEREMMTSHVGMPGWAWGLQRFSRSGGFGASQDPLPPQPILGLLGARDHLLSPRQKELVRAILGARLREIPDCGHVPQWEQPDRVARAWIDWRAEAEEA